MYKLLYLPLAQKDLAVIVAGLAGLPQAPLTAAAFIDNLAAGVAQLRQAPHAGHVYQPLKPIDQEYRVLPVQNHYLFYTVKAETIEIHRAIRLRSEMREVRGEN